MPRIALVVQRYGKEIVGGAEQLARCYAHILRDQGCDVHVVTTCAAHYLTWRNEFAPGLTQEDGIPVHRFLVDFERSNYWHQLHSLLLLRHITPIEWCAESGSYIKHDWRSYWGDPQSKAALKEAVRNLPTAIQEEFVRTQGPYSSSLLQYLTTERDTYDSFCFFTYLYATAYFGAPRVCRSKRIFVPTFQDEPPAYLPIFREWFGMSDRILYLTSAERDFAAQLCPAAENGEVIGMPIDGVSVATDRRLPDYPFLLYCGRFDTAKGSDTLVDYFLRFKQEYPSNLKLVLTGHAAVAVPEHPDIVFLGFVDEAYKFALMQDAQVFVQPSAFEALSIVLLEALLSGTPALVNSNSAVMAEHCRSANAGFDYSNYESFREFLSTLLEREDLRRFLGENGRRYVKENYSLQVVAQKLLQSVGAPGAAHALRGSVQEAPKLPAQSRQQPRRTVRVEPQVPRPKTISNMTMPEDLELRGKTDPESLDQLRDYLRESIVTPEARTELFGYIEEALLRFVNTVCLVPERTGTLLELGANPYFLTLFLKKFRRYDLELANFFSDRLAYEPGQVCEQEVTNTKYQEHHRFPYRVFNIEQDVFPYADASFDVVLFCEIIEHLVSDPVFVLEQIHRVLKPGGSLVLTTPNVGRWENVCRMAAGENIYDPYSRYGIYGRHNREYTTKELQELLTSVGFKLDQLCTRDVHPNPPVCESHRVRVSRQDTGQYIFTRARKRGNFTSYRPAWLYR